MKPSDFARKTVLFFGVAAFFGAFFCMNHAAWCEEPATLVDKTLVVWAAPETLDQHGGSALTIDMANPDAFDGIVFAERTPNVWMAGSTGYQRTEQNQAAWPKETKAGEFVRVAIAYQGKTVTIYHGSDAPVSYEMTGAPQTFDLSASIFFGPRHAAHMSDVFIGKIRDARIYPVALSAEQVAALVPGQPLDGVKAWAWWDFASTGLYEKMGRFNKISLDGDASITDGALVLGEKKGSLIARASDRGAKAAETPKTWTLSDSVPPAALESARLLREKLLADPTRPRWHFTPPEDIGMPGDPNGCFYAEGRYHLMYLYARTGGGFCWGHLSSVDLVHWRHHPDAIGPGDGDVGCFSGGGFLDDDRTCYLSYWMLWDNLGIGIAKSTDPDFNVWKKIPENPIIRSTSFGVTEVQTPEGKQIYGSADPSNIWKKDGKYYILTGNLPVLDKYGRGADAPAEMKGDRLYLFESLDLKKWDYKGVFYQRRDEWTDVSEDDMCPSFLPLPSSRDGGEPSGKHLLLFISHNKGCQYYVGTYDTKADRFLPENHGRMTWVDNTYFAPEALIDGKGRQIMWAWLLDNPNDGKAAGWSGVYGMPRTLWLGDDGTLRMAPVPELESLRINPAAWEKIALTPDAPKTLDGFPGDSFELEITVEAKELAKAKKFGVTVRTDEAAEECTRLYYDAEAKTLVFDSTASGPAGRPAAESAPLALSEGESLTLRVFVDQSVVEIYANDRQAICRRVYPSNPKKALGIALWTEGNPLTVEQVRAWEMAEANPY